MVNFLLVNISSYLILKPSYCASKSRVEKLRLGLETIFPLPWGLPGPQSPLFVQSPGAGAAFLQLSL